MDSSILIRPAQEEDALGIAEVLHAQQTFASSLMPNPEETAARTAKRLEAMDADHETVYVAALGNQLIAYGAVRWLHSFILPGPDAYLSELFVLPEHRSQHIGSQLLAKLHEEAKERGSTRLWCINLRTRESYQRGYYKKCGWEEKDIAVFFNYL